MPSAASAGFLGKLPSAGDFVQRRLPSGFAEVWDRRFELAMAEIRSGLGANWSERFQASPVWHFVLAPGACGESACAGVLGPGRDRVGRQFPMVIVAPLGAEADACARALRVGGAWFDAAEAVLRNAQFDASVSVDAFDSQVAALSSPLDPPPGEGPDDLITIDWAASDHWCFPLVSRSPALAQVNALWTQLASIVAAWSLWWTQGNERVPASVAAIRGLPQPSAYAGFLDAEHLGPPWRSVGETRVTAQLPARAVVSAGHSIEPIPEDLTDDLMDLISRPIPAPMQLGGADLALDTAAPRAACVVLARSDCELTLVAAECASPASGADTVENVAAIVKELPAVDFAPGWQSLRAHFQALHGKLRQRAEDPSAPLLTDCAVAAARLGPGRAGMLRIGNAGVWAWRQGRLQACFATGVQASSVGNGDDFDDLLFSSGPKAPPGLGAGASLSCDEETIPTEIGDRLLLASTSAVVQLSPDLLARGLAMPSCDEARARIAAACGLGAEAALWPLAVIEVNA